MDRSLEQSIEVKIPEHDELPKNKLLTAIESGNKSLLSDTLRQHPELVNTVFEQHRATGIT